MASAHGASEATDTHENVQVRKETSCIGTTRVRTPFDTACDSLLTARCTMKIDRRGCDESGTRASIHACAVAEVPTLRAPLHEFAPFFTQGDTAWPVGLSSSA